MKYFAYSLIALASLHLTSAEIRVRQFIQGWGHDQGNENQTIDLPESDPTGTDILRFNNGDLIHGKFEGLDNRIGWSRPDLASRIEFKTENIHQIVFNSANAPSLPLALAQVSLINGDQLPGEIVSLDDDNLILNSPLTGTISIPRKFLKEISPSPFDGHLHYAGPFTSDEWIMIERKKAAQVRDREDKKDVVEVAKDEKSKPSWLFSGSSFYSTNNNPIALNPGLPDVGRIRFKVSWKNRLYLSLAFHADFKRPLPPEPTLPKAEEKEGRKEEAEEKPTAEPAPLKYETLFDQVEGKALQSVAWNPESGISYPQTYGTSYVLTLNSGYPNLMRCSFAEDGSPIQTTMRTSRSNRSLQQSGNADIDLRFDRTKNTIFLYIDGQYIAQWNDLDGYLGQGGSLAFGTSNNSTSARLRISDLLITSWSGVPDAARSMQNEKRDIVLLTNGTDRFSGRLTTIKDGKATFQSTFSEMSIPLRQLSEIHFATESRSADEILETLPHAAVAVFKPVGRLTLAPSSSDQGKLKGKSLLLGDLEVDLSSATLLNFSDRDDPLDEWLTDF